MCGIVGFIGEEKNKVEIIRKMADKIVHRGPDGEGYYIDEKIALGHRRLAIIDLESGNQPMFNENKNVIIVFNGEIYNYLELKELLKNKNHKFRTNSDTEVLLHGYEEWGEELPKKLRGMFAFAIWDKGKESLFCVRDNFGIKPFYYYKKQGIFMFSSEVKAFLEHPKFEKVLNKKLIGPYLSFSFTPTNETLFKDVYSLEPGTSLTLKGDIAIIKRYYDIEFKEERIGINEASENISIGMRESVNYHKISDVEVGAFLSGGIDSSYIVSIAKPNRTYTVRIFRRKI